MKIKSLGIIIGTFLLFILLSVGKVDAASASISGNQTVTPGSTVTVTASVNAGAWDLTLSGGGQSARLLGNTNTIGNSSESKSITFVANENTTVTLTGTIKDFNASDESKPESVSKTTTIVVQSATTGDNSNAGGTTTNNSGTTNNNATNTKSSNANLSNLGIRPNDFTGFKQGTTSYKVTVPSNVEQVEVYATASHSKATISGTGRKNLKEGDNALSVVVTAEDGTKKTYTINVTREKAEEEEPEETDEPEEQEENKEDEIKNPVSGLADLKIAGVTLNPEFKSDVYEYQVKYIGEASKLEITAQATQEDYIVDVTGNEDLQEGENIITILVSNQEGDNVATYQITVNKSLVDEDAILKEQEEKRREDEKKKKMIVGAIIAGAILLAISIFFIVRFRRNRRFAEEYSGVPFSNSNEEDSWEEEEEDNQWEEELPKEELKKEYLEKYEEVQNSTDDFFEEEEKSRSGRHKGKRFK